MKFKAIYHSRESGKTTRVSTPMLFLCHPLAKSIQILILVLLSIAMIQACKNPSSSSSDDPADVYRLPDTGQTGSYTTTFGEDSDYTFTHPAISTMATTQ